MTREDNLRQARAAFAAKGWRRAVAAYVAADLESPLEAGDLDLLAQSAYLTPGDVRVHLRDRHSRSAFAAGAALLLQASRSPEGSDQFAQMAAGVASPAHSSEENALRLEGLAGVIL